MKSRVVITSVGVIGPTANDYPDFVEALREGRPGGGEVTLYDASTFPTRIAAEVPGYDPSAPFARLAERRPEVVTDVVPAQDRKTALGMSAAFECIDRSTLTDWTGRKVGLHLGTGLSSVTAEQLEVGVCPFLDERGRFDAVAFGEAAEGLRSADPWRHLTDEANRLILAFLGATGPSTSNFSACAASAQAIGRAYRDIRSGRIGRAIAGGMDSMIHPFGMISFMRLGALSTANDTPTSASRPFDRNRDGFLLGEGGAMLLLEELNVARARGATILAEVVGFGTSIDAYMVTAPHPDGQGARLAMGRALADAGIGPGEIDYINAHGTGTPLNDSTESAAIAALWAESGQEPPAVSSTKSMTGHLIAAAGAIEAVACVASLTEGYIPPSINVETLDPECDVPVAIADRAVEADVRYTMSNSFGFGGQNAALIFKRWEGIVSTTPGGSGAVQAPGFFFAGQGAQYVGMGSDYAGEFPEVYEAYGMADNALGEPISEVILHGDQETLTLTENAQPAILALGYAHAEIAHRFGVQPLVLAGHSLGEYAAWVAAGSLRVEDAVALVRLRGRAMQKAVPVGVGAMTAIISASAETVEDLCDAVQAETGRVCTPSVYNCPGNTVVSGHLDAIEELEARVSDERLGICRRLSVSAPFHCELLAPAAEELSRAIALVDVGPNDLPVIPNVSAEVVEPGCNPATIRELLVEQVVQPVRWEGCLRAAIAYGVKTACLMGPGTMIASHLKRVERRFPAIRFDDADALHDLTTGTDA